MAVREGLTLMTDLLEAGMMHGFVRDCLEDAVKNSANDGMSSHGHYSNYIDHNGDGESGDCIYMQDGKCMSAPYSIGMVNGKHTAHLDTEAAKPRMPMVTYAPISDDADNYAAMSEAKLYTKDDAGIPLCERFISKAERDKADEGDFAGKGKSFPILKPSDVMAAVHSIGRAGTGNHGAGRLKKNIIAIAKRKGFGSELPSEWKEDGDMEDSAKQMEAERKAETERVAEAARKEAERVAAEATRQAEAARQAEAPHPIEITGDFINLREGAVGQDGTVLLKVIRPGWGASGYYPADVLERDLPKIYPAGTKSYWNHATEAQERERPEGNLYDVASVSLEPVKYMENGPDGPGGYARVRASSQFRQPIDDLAKMSALGVSIRAAGIAKKGTAEGREGQIIQELTRGLSYDYVTEAGAGGKVLQLFEAARNRQQPNHSEGESMTADEARIFRETQDAVKRLTKQVAANEASKVVTDYLETVKVGPVINAEVIRIMSESALPFTATGELDKTILTKLAETETKRLCDLARKINPHLVVGMGTVSEAAALTPEQEKAARKAQKREFKETGHRYGFKTDIGARIFNEGRRAFDPTYNSRNKEAQVAEVAR